MRKNPAVPPAPVRSRRAAKREQITATLRAEIARGKYNPGDCLPKQRQLARRFGVSVLTVQRAMDRLAHEGFTEVRHRVGTFVVAHPPHRHHYALIFAFDPTDLEPGGWSHFYATLANEATKIEEAGLRRFECFYGVGLATESGEYPRLVSKMLAHQFAGLIFTAHPGRLYGTPLVDWPGVPRVGLMSADVAFPQIPVVTFKAGWFDRAFEYLAARGRRRVAFVSTPAARSYLEMNCPPAWLAKHGLVTRPYWDLALPLWSPQARHSVQLLMERAGDRPDALVITDDNLVEPAVAGLMAAGVRVPEDIEVVAHANFPRSGPRVLPLTWLGYDTRQVLLTALAILDRQMSGQKPTRKTSIEPVFERELVNRKMAGAVTLPR